MGQALSEFWVTRPSFDNPLLGEDEYRRIQESPDRAHNFHERVERIIPSLVPHKEHMSTLLPCLSDPWPSGYHSLVESLAPIDDLLARGATPHNPGQTSNHNPPVSHLRYVSSPPISFIAGGKSLAQMVSVSFNTMGKTPNMSYVIN